MLTRIRQTSCRLVVISACLVASTRLFGQPTIHLTELKRFESNETCGRPCDDAVALIATTSDPRDFVYIVQGHNLHDRNRIVRSRFGKETRIIRGSDLVPGFCGRVEEFRVVSYGQQIDIRDDSVSFFVGVPPSFYTTHSGVASYRDGRVELVALDDLNQVVPDCGGPGGNNAPFGIFTEIAALNSNQFVFTEGGYSVLDRRLHLATRNGNGWTVEQLIPPVPTPQACQSLHLDRAFGINRYSDSELILGGVQSDGHNGIFRYTPLTGSYVPLVLSGATVPGTNLTFDTFIDCAAEGDHVAFVASVDPNLPLRFFDLDAATGEINQIIEEGAPLPGTAATWNWNEASIGLSGPFVYFSVRTAGAFCYYGGETYRIVGDGDVLNGVEIDVNALSLQRNSVAGNSVDLVSRGFPTRLAFQVTLDNVAPGDRDGDGFPDESDNCPLTWQADQADWDGDGIGDLCDDDIDDDGVLNADDVCLRTRPGLPVASDGRPRSDMNGDCEANGLDLQILVHRLLSSN